MIKKYILYIKYNVSALSLH